MGNATPAPPRPPAPTTSRRPPRRTGWWIGAVPGLSAHVLRDPEWGDCICFASGGPPFCLLQCEIKSGLVPPPPPRWLRPRSAGPLAAPPPGPAKPSCRSDPSPAWFDKQIPTLAYGTTWVEPRQNRLSESTGLRCTNRDGHGFVLARENWLYVLSQLEPIEPRRTLSTAAHRHIATNCYPTGLISPISADRTWLQHASSAPTDSATWMVEHHARC